MNFPLVALFVYQVLWHFFLAFFLPPEFFRVSYCPFWFHGISLAFLFVAMGLVESDFAHKAIPSELRSYSKWTSFQVNFDHVTNYGRKHHDQSYRAPVHAGGYAAASFGITTTTIPSCRSSVSHNPTMQQSQTIYPHTTTSNISSQKTIVSSQQSDQQSAAQSKFQLSQLSQQFSQPWQWVYQQSADQSNSQRQLSQLSQFRHQQSTAQSNSQLSQLFHSDFQFQRIREPPSDPSNAPRVPSSPPETRSPPTSPTPWSAPTQAETCVPNTTVRRDTVEWKRGGFTNTRKLRHGPPRRWRSFRSD